MKSQNIANLACFALFLLPCQFVVADTFGNGVNLFDIDFVTIGDPGNASDATGNPNPAGSVDYLYGIAKFEVSRDMVEKANAEGGLNITLNPMEGVSGGPRPHMPATGVSWNEAARFTNWLNTSQGFPAAYKFGTQPGDASYDVNANIELWMDGELGFDATNPFRNSQAHYFLPSVNEWYKAAYYDPTANGGAGGYWDFPTGSNTVPSPVASGTDPGTAVYGQTLAQGPADVTQAGGPSPYGVIGLGGNVYEWEETEFDLVNDDSASARGARGAHFSFGAGRFLAGAFRGLTDGYPTREDIRELGFRVASIAQPPAVWEITQLTDNDYSDIFPQTSGGRVVWEASPGGGPHEIMFYDGQEILQLTDDDRWDFEPQITGDQVVWHGDWEIYLYEAGALTRLTNNNVDDLNAQTDGKRVVWQQIDGNDDEIFLYENGIITQLTDNNGTDDLPQISTHVVWEHLPESLESWEIHYYDGAEVVQLTDDFKTDTFPQISGEQIVWYHHDDMDGEIFLYDGTSIVQLTDNDYEDGEPQISGDRVVWQAFEGDASEIFLYDGTEVRQLTDNAYRDSLARISDDLVVWVGNDGNDDEIFAYDGNSVVQLTNNDFEDSNPEVSHRTVVWHAGLRPDDYEIFMATFSAPGDFNQNDLLDVEDVDLLTEGIRTGNEREAFDLDRDGAADRDDLHIWVKDLAQTFFGDANLDGEFNSGDLVAVFQSGEYEDAIEDNSGWGTGDWDGDGDFTSSDLVRAFEDGGYDKGPRTALKVVPEPTTTLMMIVGLLCVTSGWRLTNSKVHRHAKKSS